MDEKKIKENGFVDVLTERPLGFMLGNRHFYLYPLTLGKAMLLKQYMEALDVNLDLMQLDPMMESLRLAETKKRDVCLIIAYHTLNGKQEVFDNDKVAEVTDYLFTNADREDIASFFITILTSDKTNELAKDLGITKEQDRFRQVAQARKNTNNFQFCGQSIYGKVIDYACERYKWTFDYVLWGISYTNLQLLMADKIQDLYLSDEEKKHVSPALLRAAGQTVNMDDLKNREAYKQMVWR